MVETITPNEIQRQLLDDDAALQQLRLSPGWTQLNRILNDAVQITFLGMLNAGTNEELLDLRGQAKAYMTLVGKLDAVHGEAVHVAARLRSEIEQHRERERTALLDEQERRGRASASMALEGSGQFLSD